VLKDGKPVKGDRLTDLKVGQVRKLLKENRIDLNKAGPGVAPAIVNGDKGFSWSAEDGVQFTEVNVKPAIPDKRYTRISFQYDERVSRLQRSSTSSGEANVGVPGIFDVQGSYQTDRATRTDKRAVREHKSFSHLIPKARVVFKADKISLTSEFIERVKDAVNKADPAVSLLNEFARYGEFFASDVLLGGRLDYWTEKKLSETYTDSQDYDGFKLATRAKGTIDGVPVEGGASWEIGLSNEQKQTVIKQASSLEFLMRGGHPNAVVPETWIPTLAKFLNWGIAGYNERSLVPTIQYLEANLRAKCIRILRDYFTSNLYFDQTIKAGGLGADKYGEDVGDVSRIVQIKVNHGINIDGLKVTYEFRNGKREEMKEVGRHHGERDDVVGPLDFDEQISSIETAISTKSDHFLRRLAFNTTKGRRFPKSPNDYYGRGEVGEQLEYITIEAPRVCTIVGNAGKIVDSIGLGYRQLKTGVVSREFLLQLEPYLFPMDIPSPIKEMTLRGILIAGKWRKEEEIRYAASDDMRNTLIVELGGHSNQTGEFFWGKRDDELVGMGAIVICILQTKFHDRDWLKAHSCPEHRNALIERIHNFMGEKVEALRQLSDGELVRWGFSITESR